MSVESSAVFRGLFSRFVRAAFVFVSPFFLPRWIPNPGARLFRESSQPLHQDKTAPQQILRDYHGDCPLSVSRTEFRAGRALSKCSTSRRETNGRIEKSISASPFSLGLVGVLTPLEILGIDGLPLWSCKAHFGV